MSEAGLGAIDATYRSIPPFTAWSTNVPGHELWQRRRGEFAELRETVDDETLRRARTVAMRAAAFETGAIEDLYQTDRGLTYTVATQAAAWEQQVAERAPDALALFAAQLRAYELVLDAATAETPVSEAFIRRLHEE